MEIAPLGPGYSVLTRGKVLKVSEELGSGLPSQTLVLLPGLDGTGNLFANFVSALPAALRTIAVKYPSDRFPSYKELLPHVAAAAPTTDSFVLLAESFSTPLAMKFAATRPPNLAGLVICAGFVTNPVSTWLSCTAVLVRPFLFHISPPDFVIDHFLIGKDPPRPLRDSVRQAMSCVSPEVIALRVRAVMACDAREELRHAQLPALYLQGQRDRLVKKRSFEEIRRLKPDTILVSIRAPHFLLQCAPHEAAESIIGFVEGLAAIRDTEPKNE